jgi:exonuclease V gamma subunit
VNETVAGVRVFGRVDDLFEDAHVVVHFSRLKGRQDLGPWVRHVFLCLAAPPGTAPTTVVVGRAQEGSRVTAVRFGPVADARASAEGLIALYRAGTTAPLPFFPSASRAFAEVVVKGGDEEKARTAAVAEPDHPRTTAREPHRDPEVDLLFRGRDPHTGWTDSDGSPEAEASDVASFAATALGIYLPLLRHEEDA